MTDATGTVGVSDLPLTGERTMPGVASENYWFRRHEAAYRHVADQLAGLTGPLLDVGAGEGYGAATLARATDRTVLALDYDPAAITHLAHRYRSVHAVRANLAALPVGSRSLAAVVALQVVEHVWDHPQFVAECLRVLRPGGRLVLSTPNRLTFSPDPDRPRNPFHTHEFTAAELTGLVEAHGATGVQLHGLAAGVRLAELDRRYAPHGFVAAQLAVPPAAWSDRLAADVASVTVDDFLVEDRAGAGCLDLILIATRE